MNMTLFLAVLSSFAVLYLVLGKYASKNINNLTDYFLGGRRVGLWALSVTILATQLGGGTLIGISEETYKVGWIGLFYSLGVFTGLVLLALGVGAKIRKMQVVTLAALFEEIYQSTFLRQLAALCSIFSLFFILVAQIVACRKFSITLGFDNQAVLFGFWTVIIIYTVMGGLRAVISTDIFQALIITSIFGCLGILLIPVVDWQAAAPASTDIHWLSIAQLSDWWIFPMLFMIIGQDMGQRCAAATNPRTVTKATLLAATIYGTISLVPGMIGILAVQQGIVVPENHSILLMTITTLTNPTLSALAACAILMAILSTADSLLCAISSNVAMDFKKDVSVNQAKVITFVIGLSALVFSFAVTDIVPTMILAYRTSIYMLFWTILFGVFTESPPKQLAYLNMIAGILLSVAQQFQWLNTLSALLVFVGLGAGQVLWLKQLKVKFQSAC